MRLLLILAVVLAVLCRRRAKACTGVYIGKKVSRDHSTVIARTLDLYPLTTQMRWDLVPAAKNAPGRTLSGKDGFSWPLPDTTWRYLCTPAVSGSARGRYASAAVNEKGVAVTGTVTAYIRPEIRAMDPPVPSGLCEEVIPDLIGACASSAREGVELLGRVIAQAGNAEQNVILIADKNEAWLAETYTGRQWAALRLPQDRAAVFGNQFMLAGHREGEDGFLCSPGLFALPEKAGLARYDGLGRMDLFATYAGCFSDFANGRTWLGRKTFAPSSAGEYASGRRFSLCFEPDGPVSAKDVMELFRARFESTPYCPDETGRRDWRVIGSESTCTSHVLCVYDDLPAEAACLGWFSLANAEHSVYLPANCLVASLDDVYTKDAPQGRGLTYDPSLACVRMKRLCALAEQDRTLFGAGVRRAFSLMEERMLRETADLLGRTRALLRNGQHGAACALWTDYVREQQKAALSRADRMFDGLIWYLMGTTDSIDYDYRWRTMEMTPREKQPYRPEELPE